MPVQINEMIIRANVTEPGDPPAETPSSGDKSLNKEEIIRECTQVILEILNNKKER